MKSIDRRRLLISLLILSSLFVSIPSLTQNVFATNTTDTIGATGSNSGFSGLLIGYAITASASGSLVSVGIDLQTCTTGHIRTGIYANLTNSPTFTFTNLLGQSSSVSCSSGWNDLSVTGVTITATVVYYIVFTGDGSNVQQRYYYDASGLERYYGFTYGTLPSTTGTLTSDTATGNMRIIYSPAATTTGFTRIITQSFTNSPVVTRSVVETRVNAQTMVNGISVTRSQGDIRVDAQTLTDSPSLSRGLDNFNRVVTQSWTDGVSMVRQGAVNVRNSVVSFVGGTSLSNGIANLQRTITSGFSTVASALRGNVVTERINNFGVSIGTSLSRGGDSLKRAVTSGFSTASSLVRGIVSTERINNLGVSITIAIHTTTNVAASFVRSISVSFSASPSVSRATGAVRATSDTINNYMYVIGYFFAHGVVVSCPPDCPSTPTSVLPVVVVVAIIAILAMGGFFLFMRRRRVY